MLTLMRQLWRDDHGVILSSELVIVGTVLVVGMITGTACLQKAVDCELRDLGSAIGSLDQSYSFSAHRKSGFGGHCCAWTAGSSWMNCEADAAHRGDMVGCVDGGPVVLCPSPCDTCGSAACGGCGAAAPCGDSGKSAAISYSVRGHVGNVRWSETVPAEDALRPIADPLASPPQPCDDCESPCPAVAVPVTPPCVRPGDIIIPDCVW